MFFKVLAVAGLIAISSSATASAQGLSGPAELPPSSFKGAQYVDSQGCVFLRAGVGGRVTWVPRISRDRKAICGPSRAEAARADAARAEAARAEAARMAEPVGQPMETVAAQQRPVVRRAIPAIRPAPRVVPAPPVVTAPVAARTNGCPATAPYGARVVSDGQRKLVCSANPNFDVQAAVAHLARNAARTNGAPKLRVFSPGAGYRCPADAPVARRYAVQGGGTSVMCSAPNGSVASVAPLLAVPDGYKTAWKDDRLNPRRGQGTVRGQAQQDRVWTRDVPAMQVKIAPQTARKTGATSNSKTPRGRYFVQVGTFGEPANAQRSVARLQVMGLPVTRSNMTRKEHAMQIVMAGPFSDARAAHTALAQARRSGFGDAFIR